MCLPAFTRQAQDKRAAYTAHGLGQFRLLGLSFQPAPRPMPCAGLVTRGKKMAHFAFLRALICHCREARAI